MEASIIEYELLTEAQRLGANDPFGLYAPATTRRDPNKDISWLPLSYVGSFITPFIYAAAMWFDGNPACGASCFLLR